MSENAITRRSFLAGSAGAVALTAAAGYMGFDAWEQAHADDASGGGETKTVHTLCNACSSKCGYTAYVVNGRLTKLIGDMDHPYSKGKLCARGYGYSQIAYSEDRLTDPLKKNDQGKRHCERKHAGVERPREPIEAEHPMAAEIMRHTTTSDLLSPTSAPTGAGPLERTRPRNRAVRRGHRRRGHADES